MQIACPNCKTRYQIEPASLGANGRSTRCARCRHVWFARPPLAIAQPPKPAAASADKAASDDAVVAFGAELGPPALEPSPAARPAANGPSLDELAGLNAPPADNPGVEAAAAAEPAKVGLADITIPVEDAPPLVPAPGEAAPRPSIAPGDGRDDIESVAARRARAERRRKGRIPLPLVIVVLGVAVAALLGLRKTVVHYAPQLASFYGAIGLPVNMRGAAFTDLKIGNELHDGVPVLVVEGMIVSMTSKPIDVPRVRFALRNASGAEIYSWTAQPSQPVLEPFDSMPFRSRLAAPPAEGHDVQVRFFTSRDAAASR